MHKITGLWKGTSSKGTTYYSGKVGNTRVMVFKNDKRPGKNDADLQVMIAKVDDGQPWSELLPAEEATPPARRSEPSREFSDLDDEIPF